MVVVAAVAVDTALQQSEDMLGARRAQGASIISSPHWPYKLDVELEAKHLAILSTPR